MSKSCTELSLATLCTLKNLLLCRGAAEAGREAADLQAQLKELQGVHEVAAAERDALQLECSNLRAAVGHLECVITGIC